MVVSVLGGDAITNGETKTIYAGNSLSFQITNSADGCSAVTVRSIIIDPSTDFLMTPSDLNFPSLIKSKACVQRGRSGEKYLNFKITANDSDCGTITTKVTIEYNNNLSFIFNLTVERAPIISVLGGGSPPTANIIDGTTTTTGSDGTYFGVVEVGASVTRTFHIMNTGSCPLELSSISSSIASPVLIDNFTIATQAATFPQYIDPGFTFWIDVTFTADVPADNRATITIVNNDSASNPFTFNVSAEVFDFDIIGPGGVTADFRLWLKATRGVVEDGSDKVSLWKDLGVNGKNASAVTGKEPTYIDDVASNINFNPVIEFKNNGISSQYLENLDNGFFSQDIFIVIKPNSSIIPFSSASTRSTIFAGVSKKTIGDVTFHNNDITGVGYGNYTTRFLDEVLTYAQDVDSPIGTFNGISEISKTKNYTNPGIINVRNNDDPATAQELLYNSNLLTTAPINDIPFANVGYIHDSIVFGTPYWIGKNYGDLKGNLNGRIAEIMTFSERVPDTDRPKIETYLAIKHGITLGSSNFAEKDYVNSAGTVIWDISVNDGFNHNVAGIGLDKNSDLNQKQSKSVNDANEVTIGLGGLYTKNSENINEFNDEFSAEIDFLVWGCNDGTFSESITNTVTIATGITTSLTRINRKWKIVETGGDVGNVFAGIPAAAFSGFPKSPNEEYVLIVSGSPNFTDGDIIDVVPLKIDKDPNGNPIKDKYNSEVYKTWYDFDDIKYFTFGKAPKLDSEKRSVNITENLPEFDYLVGETDLALNYNAFTVSAWIRNVTPSTLPRTIMAKGAKMQMRVNSNNNIEVVLDDDSTPSLTSTIQLNDDKWHQITFVYDDGTIYLYLDGILGCSGNNISPPTPNFNRFSVGVLYLTKNDIKNRFLGEIDEVYIWNRVLTQDQIRFLMNQEIEKVGSEVNGRVLPQSIPNNDEETIPWSDLKAFYDFNSFYGSTVEGLSNERDFLRIKYLKKNKTIVQAQTAPLPYTTKEGGTGNWDDPETWTYGDLVWNIPNSLGLDGLTTIDWNIVETEHNIASDRDITVLGLKNNSGKITIDGTNANADGPVPGTGHSLRVTHYLELDGTIDLEGESQLLQDPGSILDQDSGGYIEKDQQGTANSFNYNYWSSSVGPILVDTNTKNSRGIGTASTNAPFTIKGIINDGRSASPTPPTPPPGILSILYGTSPYAADKAPGAQLTISSYWLYTFYGADDNYWAWKQINQSTPILAGEGYTMKGSSGKVPIIKQQNYVFKGKPYNGDFTLPIEQGKDRLIGNPYPSAMDADEFIKDNIKETINSKVGRNQDGKNIFNGALYFWDHFGEKDSHYLAAYVGGYATYTLMGGARAYSNDTRINNDGSHGNKRPGQYIPVGQGFFVIAVNDSLTNSLENTTINGGDIVFKNSQRTFMSESLSNSVFMKGIKPKLNRPGGGKKNTDSNIDTRPKIWLQFDSPTGYHRQLLVGIDEKTTNHFDLGFDAIIADIGSEDMFWTFDGAKFVIQGVPNFNTNQEFSLGVKIAKTGLATIKIDELENMDDDISAHIKDKLTGEIHNISQKPFEINLEPGTYLDRFVLIFKMQKLVAEDVVAEVLIPSEMLPIIEGIHVFMNNDIKELQIKNNSDDEILNIELYNYLGQTIKTWNSNFKIRTISLPVNIATGVYLVQINTKTGSEVQKVVVE